MRRCASSGRTHGRAAGTGHRGTKTGRGDHRPSWIDSCLRSGHDGTRRPCRDGRLRFCSHARADRERGRAATPRRHRPLLDPGRPELDRRPRPHPGAVDSLWLAFDHLTIYDQKLQPQPMLAESWDLSTDFKQVKFNLRKGVTYHSGREFTSDDVKWNLLRVRRPGRGFGSVRRPEQLVHHHRHARTSTPSSSSRTARGRRCSTSSRT